MSEPTQYTLLALQGEFLNDLEKLRIANSNRLQAMQTDLGIVDGPEIATAEKMTEIFTAAEKLVTKDLREALRQTPLAEWVKGTVGVGEKQGARLLAVIGNPCRRYDNEADEWHPRTIAQLWAYCGYHVVSGAAPSRRRGEQGNWNTQARTRAYLIAESCVKKANSPYRPVYDEGRAKYADAVHHAPCKRCGPSGKPAQPGSPLSKGHQHARAMRLVAKAILKDLWLAARSAEKDFDGARREPEPKADAPRRTLEVASAA